MRSWAPIDRAPRDGRWIIAINRHEPDRRAVIRWDPGYRGDAEPWHVATCDHGFPEDAFTDWQPFPDWPKEHEDGEREDGGRAARAVTP